LFLGRSRRKTTTVVFSHQPVGQAKHTGKSLKQGGNKFHPEGTGKLPKKQVTLI